MNDRRWNISSAVRRALELEFTNNAMEDNIIWTMSI